MLLKVEGDFAKNDDFENEQQMNTVTHDTVNHLYKIKMKQVFREDLMVEIKARIVAELKSIVDKLHDEHPGVEPASEFDLEYLNHSLQFFNKEEPLDDYIRFESIVKFL